MEAVAEQAVVRPVRSPAADGGDGDEIDEEHDHGEDGKSPDAVREHAVDFIRRGHLHFIFLFIASFDDFADEKIAFVGDDAFGVVHFLFRGDDVFFHVIENFLREVKFFTRFFVALENLHGVPALFVLGKIVHSRFFDMRDGVFHGAREGVMGNGFSRFCRFDRRFRRFHDAFVFQSGNFHHFAAEGFGKHFRIDLIAALFYDVHHVDGNHDG